MGSESSAISRLRLPVVGFTASRKVLVVDDNADIRETLQELIAEGETEGLYLECKSPSSPNLNKDLRVTLAKAISGFANTPPGRQSVVR